MATDGPLLDGREVDAPAARPPAVGSALRGSIVYAGASAAQRGLLFVLLPVYTRALSPADYGQLSVLLAISAAAAVVLSLGMDTAFFRTYFALRDDPAARRRFVTTAWVFLMTVPPGAALLVGLAGAPLLTGNDIVPPVEFALALAGSASLVSATIVPLALLRAEERLRDYLIFAGITSFLTTGGTLVGVVVLDGGVAGWLIAVVGANVLTLLAAVWLVPFRPKEGLDRALLKSALVLGLPLVPHVLSHWGLGVSNRLVLTGQVSVTKVGIYSLASNIALPVAILTQGLAQGFMPSFAKAANDRNALKALDQVVVVQFVIVLLTALAGALLGPLAVQVLAPSEYQDAAELVPWLVLGYAFLGLYFIPMNAVSLTEGRTGRVWIITVFAAIVNLVGLVLLVPPFGLVGAAASAPAGYLVLLVGVWMYSRGPGNPVRYETAVMLRGAAVGALVYILAVTSTDGTSASDALLRVLWLVVALALLVLVGVIDGGRLRRALSARWRIARSR